MFCIILLLLVTARLYYYWAGIDRVRETKGNLTTRIDVNILCFRCIFQDKRVLTDEKGRSGRNAIACMKRISN